MFGQQQLVQVYALHALLTLLNRQVYIRECGTLNIIFITITNPLNGREANGNEEREKKEDEKGSHCFFKSSRYDKLELKHQNLVFSSL